MTETEKKLLLRQLLKNKGQEEEYGDFADIEDGTYEVTIRDVYSSVNVNGKEFIGIKCVMNSGDYEGNFFIDCLYFNDEALERGLQKSRNILSAFGEPDLNEEDFTVDSILDRLSVIKNKEIEITVETDGDLKHYEYKKIG